MDGGLRVLEQISEEISYTNWIWNFWNNNDLMRMQVKVNEESEILFSQRGGYKMKNH